MSRLPKLVSGCDIRSLPLTPAEGFLLSRVDAIADEEDLALCTGIPAGQVAAMLDRLETLGAIAFAGGRVTHTRARTVEIGAPAAYVAPPGPAEPDRDDAGRRTGPRPPDQDDTAALRRKMLARKLSGTIARTTPPVRTPTDRESILRSYEAASAQAEQAAEAARRAQLEKSLEQGKAALAREDFTGALDAYRAAASLATDDPRAQAVCEEGIRSAAAALAEGHWREAVAAETEGRWEDALLGYARVCAGRPGDPVAHQRGAIAALRSDNVRRAVDFARKAVELAPGSAKLHVTLARAYAAAGFETSADAELDRALALGSDDPEIKSLVSRLRSLQRSAGKAG